MSYPDNAFSLIPQDDIDFQGIAQLSRSVGADLLFVDLSASAPLKAEKFGIVELALFRVCANGRAFGHHTRVNPECAFDEMTSRALGLSTKDVINYEPWGTRLSSFFEKAIADGAWIVSLDPHKWVVPALGRALAMAGSTAVAEHIFSADVRPAIGNLVLSGAPSGNLAHLVGQLGTPDWPAAPGHVRSVLQQAAIVNHLVNTCGVEAVADQFAGAQA